MDCRNCDLCRERNREKPDVTWCPICKHFLCMSCDRLHCKKYPDHNVTTHEKYKQIPDYILSVTNVCEIHGKTYSRYCKNHEQLCCVVCLTERHTQCNGLSPMDKILSQVRSGSKMVQLGTDFGKIKENIVRGMADVKNELSALKFHKKQSLSNISTTRKLINEHLDNIEDKLREELKDKTNSLKRKFKKAFTDLEELSKNLEKIVQEIVNIERYGSDLQFFFGVEDLSIKKDRVIQNIEQINKISSIELNINKEIDSIKNLPAFGEVCFVETGKIFVNLLPSYMNQPQVNVPRETKHIIMPNTVIHGCDIMPDGTLLFTDPNNKNLVIKSDDKDTIINLKGEPFDVSHTMLETVCISFPEKRKIRFIDITTKAKLTASSSLDKCYGIAKQMQQHERLALRTIDDFSAKHQIVLLDLSGQKCRVLEIPGEFIRQISINGSEIKCTNRGTNSVLCYSHQGNLVWTFKNESVLRYPAGIAEDSHGNVYVAGRETNNVVVITPDGEHYRELLSEKDGLKEPFALCINVNRNELMVCNLLGIAFLYNL